MPMGSAAAITSIIILTIMMFTTGAPIIASVITITGTITTTRAAD